VLHVRHRALPLGSWQKGSTVGAVEDILADIPMDQLAAQGGGASGSTNPLNDLLNSMLGGGAAGGGAAQSSGGSILDVLGDLLGAGRR
jgi:hypothetical protein